MSIFSRRNVQRMIDENSKFLSTEDVISHVTKLNKNNFQSLDTEWEIAVLNAFSKLGQVEHEKNFGGSTYPDLCFTAENGVAFVADVTTVSDEGFEEKNPYKVFNLELVTRIQKFNITKGGFRISIGRLPTEKYGEPTKMALPKRGDFSKEIFTTDWKLFMAKVAQEPDVPRTYRVDTETTKLTIAYTPGDTYFTTNLPAFTMANKINNNPVWNSIKSKHSQLSKSGYKGIRGIILCDAGSDMITAERRSSWEPDHSAEDVAAAYLRTKPNLAFVLVLSARWTKKRSYEPGPTRFIEVSIVGNTGYEKLPESLRKAIHDLKSNFPEPSNTASGARDTIRNGYNPIVFRPLSGGFVSGKNITISANSVLALLAGYVTWEEFWEKLGLKPPAHGAEPNNMFAQRIKNNQRISKVTLEDTPYEDSNMTFEFVHNPSTSPFRVP